MSEDAAIPRDHPRPGRQPGFLVYMEEPEGSTVRLAAASGIERGHPAAPEVTAIDRPSLWPVGEVLAKDWRVLRNQQRRKLGQTELRALRGPEVGVHPGPAARRLRIVFVEDGALIRSLTSEMLASLDHSVTEAGEAAQALNLLSQRAFDVLMTDLALPGLRGDELAASAAGLHPDFAGRHCVRLRRRAEYRRGRPFGARRSA